MKHFVRCLITALCMLGLGSPLAFASKTDTVRIGVLAFRPKPQTLAQWQPLSIVLKRAMPDHDFIIEALTFPELEAAIASQRLDFAITNPGHYVLLAQRNGLSAPLATLISNEGGQPLSAFGGVIFSRADRTDIKTLPDLRGKTIATVSADSLGGYQMQVYELFKAGIPMPQNVFLATGMPHDLVAQAVLSGKADAGFVRTSVLEAMVHEGKLDLSHLKILNRQESPDFPYQVSTQLYPEWPFTVLKHTDEHLARHVAAALFLMDQNSPETRAMGIYGFTTPADYTPVVYLLRELRLPPFDATPHFTTQDVWKRYRLPILVASFSGGLILLLGIRLLWTNRHLVAEKRVVQMQAKQLQESEARFRTVADFTFDWEYWEGQNQEIIYMTPSCERITGYSPVEFAADPGLLLRIIHPEDRRLMDQHLHDIAYQDGSLVDFRIVRRDGEIRWITHNCRAVSDRNGQPMGRRVSNRDNTERKQALLRLYEEKAFSQTLINSLPGVFYHIDSNGRLVGWNDALETLLGPEGLRLAQISVLNTIYEEDRELAANKIGEGFEKQTSEAELRIKCSDGSNRYHYFIGKTLDIEGHTYLLGSGIDISDRKRMEGELREQATTDALTGLANRRHFFARMEEELARMQRSDTLRTAVLMLDLDYFKRINDTYGHAKGDMVLRHFAALVRDGLRKIDIVGRIGGEEFAIILPGADLTSARDLAERLRLMVADMPLTQEGAIIPATVSIGIANMNSKDPSAETALKRADKALYRAKQHGRNCVEVAAEASESD